MSEEVKQEIEAPKPPTQAEISEARKRLELLLTRLYNDPNDRFYAHLFYHVDREVNNTQCPTMGVGMLQGRLKLVYNTNFLQKLSDKAATVILKHEALHLINEHIQRGQGAKENNKTKHMMENIAQDCAINQYLDNDVITEIGGVTLESFRKLLTHQPPEFQLKERMTAEYYMELLEQEKQDREENGDSQGGENGEGGSLAQELSDLEMDDHGQFGQMDALDRAMLEEKIKQAAESARANGAGRLPEEVEDILAMKKKPTQNWKRLLKRFVGQGVKANNKSSRSRRNRRYGIKVAGKKKDHIAKILVVLDTSGSMCWGGRTEKVLSELYGIWKQMPDSKLDIVECDAQISDVFTYDGKSEFKISGRGGTNMEPAYAYADKNKYDGVIFLTDGEFWNENFTGYKTPSMWVIAGNASYKSPVGQTVHLPEGE